MNGVGGCGGTVVVDGKVGEKEGSRENQLLVGWKTIINTTTRIG